MKKFAILLSTLVLLVASLACGSDATPAIVSTAVPPNVQNTEPPAPTDAPTAATIQTYNVGDAVSIGDITLTVNAVTFPAGDQYNKPDEGKKFIVIDLTIENKGASSYSVSSIIQMTLKDDTGQKYNVDLSASMASDGTTPDGEIAASDKLRGQVGFQIPTNATGLVFIFDAEIFGGGQVRISIPNQ